MTAPSRTPIPAALALAIAVGAALVAACVLPVLVGMVQSQYGFSMRDYWEVYVHRHHKITTWVERGWPDILFPISVVLAPLVGGLTLQLLRSPAGSPPRPFGFRTTAGFGVSYAVAVLLAGALAGSMHPYPFRWSAYPGFVGLPQLVTLLLLAGALAMAGAALANRLRARSGGPSAAPSA